MGQTPNRKRVILLTLAGLGLVNFLAFAGIILYFGGTPQESIMTTRGTGTRSYLVLDGNGNVEEVDYESYKRLQSVEGKYYIEYRGRVTQVSRGIHRYLRIHGDVTIILFLAVFPVAAYLAITQHLHMVRNKLGIYSEEASRKRARLKIMARVLVILVLGFLLTFWLLCFLT